MSACNRECGEFNARENSDRCFGHAPCNRERLAEDNKACVTKATATLPQIAGLVVKKTRTRPAPPEILATWQGQARPIMVDVDTVTPGAAETYSYICVLTKGSAFVRRVMS